MNVIAPSTPLPPFCTIGADRLPQGPRPGTPESGALAAWEVLTGARVARSTGSGRLSLLGAYRAEGRELTRDRVIWIALHAFEGASERWLCRLARNPAMSDGELNAAVVQEMGGPAHEPDEMTTLGFWLGDTGFSFDCRGPLIEIFDCVGDLSTGRRIRRRRIDRGGIVKTARSLLRLPAGRSHVGYGGPESDQEQLCFL